MKVAIGCDHRGYKLKETLKRYLNKNGYLVHDFGTHGEKSCDYPNYCLKVALAVAKRKADYGILICLTGIGSSIAANKVPGIRAALCHTIKSAVFSRAHNDANLLVLGSGWVNKDKAKEIVKKWLATDFSGGRHKRRVGQISQIEKRFIKKGVM